MPRAVGYPEYRVVSVGIGVQCLAWFVEFMNVTNSVSECVSSTEIGFGASVNLETQFSGFPSKLSFVKYIPTTFARKLIDEGTVRLRSLLAYKSAEMVGKARSDSSEGTSADWVYAHHLDIRVNQRLPGIGTMPPGSLTILNSVFHYVSEPAIAYCISARISRKLASKFADPSTPHCPASCIEINNPMQFVRMMDSALREKIHDLGSPYVGAVWYGPRDGLTYRGTSVRHPAFVKDFMYADEAEVRVCWPTRSRGSSVEPVDLQIANVPSVLRLMKFSEFQRRSDADKISVTTFDALGQMFILRLT